MAVLKGRAGLSLRGSITMKVSPGDAVLTKYGTAGVVVRLVPAEEGVDGEEVGLVEWVSFSIVDTAAAEEEEGDVQKKDDPACITRPPLLSCKLATIHVSDVIRQLVAAPGTIVRVTKSSNIIPSSSSAKDDGETTSTQLFIIEEYLESTDSYTAYPLGDTATTTTNDGDQIRHCQLSPEQIVSSSCKFYPMMMNLIDRAEVAWNDNIATITENNDILNNSIDSLSTVVESTIDNTVNSVINTNKEIVVDGSKSLLRTIGDTSVNIGSSSSIMTINTAETTEEVKRIYEMLRNKDLMELFTSGQQRLKDLVEVEVPEKTRQTLIGMGIELDDDDDDDKDGSSGTYSSMGKKMDKLRKEALSSLNDMIKLNTTDILQKNATTTEDILDMTTTMTSMSENTRQQFVSAFDKLSKAAISDPQLANIFDSISEKTKTWQEMTGRVLQTKTAGLFVEGAQRLTARAAEILKSGSALADKFGSGNSNDADLMRAFTEGDIAKAKLKSMEMGDAVRKRLFDAIELRSESSGGLDAIIAGSLTKVHQASSELSSRAVSLLGEQRQAIEGLVNSNDEGTIRTIVDDLQRNATSTMKGTKESLIALLSSKSGHRNAALLRLERTLIDLELQLGQDLTAEQIANIASGEGGTMALFEPIAARAAREIEAQLDVAEARMKESEHWNPKVDDVMANVRKITRGELGVVDLLEMATGYLDDEDVLTKSGGLIVKAENFLDNFEAASARLGGELGKGGGTAGAGIMDAVAKAGITKSAVMRGVEGLDMNKLLDDTQSAITDDNARRELISSAGDSALDFLLKILPEMPVPPFDGVREGLVYHLSNLSMAGFKVKKEDVCIEIAGMRAAAQSTSQQPTIRKVKASELLIIDIRNISAILDDAVWSFEQTYMPYLKGNGKANTKLWDGAIRLKFELRKRVAKIVIDPDTGEEVKSWEPVLCLNDRSCSIGGVELKIQGESKIAWVANKLTSLLGTKLRDYLVIVIINALTSNSARLIDMLNSNLCNYWDFIMRTAKLELDKLPELEVHHVTKAVVDVNEDLVELVWRERVPLGLNLLTNDSSGILKVIDLPRGTQARVVAQANQLDPDLFKGATIVAVNGKRYGPDSQVELFTALKDPARPKAILFKLSKSQNELERIDRIIKRKNGSSDSLARSEGVSGLVATVKIDEEGSIGVRLTSNDNFALAVKLFLSNPDGDMLPVEESGMVMVGDLLSHVNGTLVLAANGEGKKKAYSLLERVGKLRPLSLGFVKPFQYSIIIKKDNIEDESLGGPSELQFVEVDATTNSKEKTFVLKDFAPAEGAAEKNGVLVGDNLIFVNGFPVGAGCKLLGNGSKSPTIDEVGRMLKEYSPLVLGFARAKAKQTRVQTMTSSALSLDIETAHTFSVAASNYHHLGCKFAAGMNGTDIVVKDIIGVEGPFTKQIKESMQPIVGCKLESVDGEVLPSYANPQLIISAMKRRWDTNGRVELLFCDERQKEALMDIISADIVTTEVETQTSSDG